MLGAPAVTPRVRPPQVSAEAARAKLQQAHQVHVPQDAGRLAAARARALCAQRRRRRCDAPRDQKGAGGCPPLWRWRARRCAPRLPMQARACERGNRPCGWYQKVGVTMRMYRCCPHMRVCRHTSVLRARGAQTCGTQYGLQVDSLAPACARQRRPACHPLQCAPVTPARGPKARVRLGACLGGRAGRGSGRAGAAGRSGAGGAGAFPLPPHPAPAAAPAPAAPGAALRAGGYAQAGSPGAGLVPGALGFADSGALLFPFGAGPPAGAAPLEPLGQRG